ncbi:MAG: radical SAM protein [Actinobacteria bacterium]|nr:radical SAM protein [Actinomycetota bacterium]
MTDAQTRERGELALERARNGERLTAGEIVALYAVPAEEVIPIANAARLRKTDPEYATFSMGGNIDYTSICNVACKFCTFYRTPRQEGAYALTPEQVIEQLEPQVRLGVTEVMIQGGVNPELPYEWYIETLRLVKQTYPDLFVDFLSPEEIRGLEKLTGRDAKDILAELQANGMDGMPGASAEILVDEVRQKVAPARISSDDWFRIVDNVLDLGIHIHWTGLVFGLGETIEQRVEHLVRLRDAQDRDLERGGRGLGAYKVWPMRLNDTRLNGVIEIDDDQTIIDKYLQQVAIHRLALDNIDHHRCVWRTMGYGTAAKALRAGADDLCGTGAINAVTSVLETAGKEAPRPSEKVFHGVLKCIADAGFKPAERDPFYNVTRVHSLDDVDFESQGHDYVAGFQATADV